jgi:hypothetical protein
MEDAVPRGRHVILNPKGGWSVLSSGARRATRVFPSQEAAIDFARRKASQEGGELYVHRSDGTVREHDSYRRESSLARGKR